MSVIIRDGRITIRPSIGGDVTLGLPDTKELRDHFQHERDEELGRWRWPENPDYVVYPKVELQARDNTRGVTVLTERIPRTYTVWEDNVKILYGTSSDEVARQGAREAARAYFEAHPERKPWHDAKAGDAWVLTDYRGKEHAMNINARGDFQFLDGHASYPIDSPAFASAFASGRRIWPEPS